jgi:hypothetical protein
MPFFFSCERRKKPTDLGGTLQQVVLYRRKSRRKVWLVDECIASDATNVKYSRITIGNALPSSDGNLWLCAAGYGYVR